jgi:hypothetical protein
LLLLWVCRVIMIYSEANKRGLPSNVDFMAMIVDVFTQITSLRVNVYQKPIRKLVDIC